MAAIEIFDLTEGDHEGSQEDEASEEEDELYSVLMITDAGGACEKSEEAFEEVEFHDCLEEIEMEGDRKNSVPRSTAEQTLETEEVEEVEVHQIRMIKNVNTFEVPTVTMTLDSGADLSVAPMEYYSLGLPGGQRTATMVDAQGEKIQSTGNRKLKLIVETRDGDSIEFIEQFALGRGVTHPLMCLGRLLRTGWVVMQDNEGLYLENRQRDVQIPARLERNSLVMDVRICAVKIANDHGEVQEEDEEKRGGSKAEDQVAKEERSRSESSHVSVKGQIAEDTKFNGVELKLTEVKIEGTKMKEEAQCNVIDLEEDDEVDEVFETLRVMALKGYLSRELALLEGLPGWHVLPNGVVVYSDPQATHLLDASGSFGREWCSRMTLVKIEDSGGMWEQVESVANYREGVLPYRPLPGGGPKKPLTFVAIQRLRDYYARDSEVPVSQHPLLDGEYASWPDDEDEDAREGGEIPVLAAEGEEQPEVREEVEFVDPREIEVQIDEDLLTMRSSLKDLAKKCSELGLPTSGNKSKVLERPRKYKHNEEERLAFEIAQRLYSESRREAIPIKTPKLPTRHEQEMHSLTHLPYQDWCQQCVANRAREGL